MLPDRFHRPPLGLSSGRSARQHEPPGQRSPGPLSSRASWRAASQGRTPRSSTRRCRSKMRARGPERHAPNPPDPRAHVHQTLAPGRPIGNDAHHQIPGHRPRADRREGNPGDEQDPLDRRHDATLVPRGGRAGARVRSRHAHRVSRGRQLRGRSRRRTPRAWWMALAERARCRLGVGLVGCWSRPGLTRSGEDRLGARRPTGGRSLPASVLEIGAAPSRDGWYQRAASRAALSSRSTGSIMCVWPTSR
jgi:hypothetical protein